MKLKIFINLFLQILTFYSPIILTFLGVISITLMIRLPEKNGFIERKFHDIRKNNKKDYSISIFNKKVLHDRKFRFKF